MARLWYEKNLAALGPGPTGLPPLNTGLDRRLTIPEAKECVKDRREWRRIVGGDVDDPG